MKICVLCSGSDGNCIYVASEKTAILIDAGQTFTRLNDRMAEVGVNPAELNAIVVTHEHTDHCQALPQFFKRFPKIELYANNDTSLAVDNVLQGKRKTALNLSWSIFETGAVFSIGDLTIESIPIQHDAASPVALVVSDAAHRAAVATDLGCSTPLLEKRLDLLDAIILETNHDPEMLTCSSRHEALKNRIRCDSGHLSNFQAAKLLAKIATPKLKAVFTAHVSQDCNTDALVFSAIKAALREARLAENVRIIPTRHNAVSETLSL